MPQLKHLYYISAKKKKELEILIFNTSSSFYCTFAVLLSMRVTGLEPARRGH